VTPPGLGTPRLTDVVVVGGGLTGSATAWALARRGVGVVLLERFGPGRPDGPVPNRAVAHDPSLVAEGRRLWAELVSSSGTAIPGNDPAAVAALQAAAVVHGAVVRHHRRVEAVRPLPDGEMLVRPSSGASVRARAVVVAVGGPAQPRWSGPVVVATGSAGWEAAPALGEVLADRALGVPVAQLAGSPAG
jgi:glycine/D-amino acid oxidase-like deaminating enzyme